MGLLGTDGLYISLIIILCTTLLYLLLNQKITSRPLRHSPINEPQSKRNLTFRVRGVPLEWTINDLQDFLRDHDELASPRVKSLSPEVHDRNKTGTVIFGNFTLPRPGTRINSHVQISINNPLVRHASQGRHLTLDNDFLGVTVLSTPPVENHRIDILAVSGLGGHAFGSFKHKNSDHMWLRDALPADLHISGDKCPMARVMVYGYNSSIAGSESFQETEDLATAFRMSLLTLAHNPARPIILIGHSLGGMIIKHALIQLSKSQKEDERRLLRAVYGILFFGVPHLGMDVSSFIPLAGDGPNRSLIDSFSALNSQSLLLHERDFHAALGEKGESEIICFYETVKSPTPRKDLTGKWSMTGPTAVMVNPSSATSSRPWESGREYHCAVNRTHSELVKFEPHDSDYDVVLQYLKGLAQRSLVSRNPKNEAEKLRKARWSQHVADTSNTVRVVEVIGVDNFRALHEKDLDREFPGRSFWYRETIANDGYPRGVQIDPYMRRDNSIRPVSNEIITLRRVANLQIRGHAKWIVPGSYQSVWIFWFFDGEITASSHSGSQPGHEYSPSANTMYQRYFAPETDTQDSWVQDCRSFQPWDLRCSVGQARDPKNFLVQDVNVDKHRRIPPALLREGYGESLVSHGLWNTLKNIGWREVQGPNVEVGADGEAFFLISKDFVPKWVGGFSFGGIRLEPVT